jgi:hypothetical protein
MATFLKVGIILSEKLRIVGPAVKYNGAPLGLESTDEVIDIESEAVQISVRLRY